MASTMKHLYQPLHTPPPTLSDYMPEELNRPRKRLCSDTEADTQPPKRQTRDPGSLNSLPVTTTRPHSHQSILEPSHYDPKPREVQAYRRTIGFSQLQASSEVKRLASNGGPDLSDLRGYQHSIHSRMSQPSTSTSRKRPASDATTSNKSSKKPSPHDRNFQQKLVDGGIYPSAYRYPNGEESEQPTNLDSINKALAQPRPSLSPSRVSREDFKTFIQAEADAFGEKQVTTSVIPIIEGKLKDGKCVAGGVPLTNLHHLIDGPFAPCDTDHYYGARPEQLDRSVRENLSHYIIPATQDDLPMAPNFFLAVKGPDGSPAVMKKQACYDGVLGARGIHSLQVYGKDIAYDGCAYTFTSTYQDGQLKMFTSHPSQPRQPGERPTYHMTQINSWSMTGNIDSFRQGATWFRNGRDLAEQWRNKFIASANETTRCEGEKADPSSTISSSSKDTSASPTGPKHPESETSEDHSEAKQND